MRLIIWILICCWVAWKRADKVRNRQTLFFLFALLLLPQLIRLLLIVCYPENFASSGVLGLLQAGWKGFPFDLSMASLVGAAGLLLLNLPIVNNLYRKSVIVFCALTFEVYALVLVADLVFFRYVERHVSSEIFDFFHSIPLVLDLAVKSYTWICLGLVVLFAAGIYAVFWYASRTKAIRRGPWFYELFFLVLLGGFLWFGERGYFFANKPITPRLIYTDGLSQGHLMLNGAFNICYHLMPQHYLISTQALDMSHPSLQELSDDESIKIAHELLQSPHEKWQGADFPLQRVRTQFSLAKQKRNLIVFALESLDLNVVDALSGRQDGATPNLDALIRQGQVFDHFFSCGDGLSVIGIGSSMSGLCWVSGASWFGRGRGLEQTTQNGLGHLFTRAGYDAVFVRSCADAMSFIGPMARLMGFRTLGKKEIIERTGKRSVHDAEALEVLAEEFKNSKKPFFGFFFSTATHEPFDSWGPKKMDERIEKKFPELSYLRALAYTDDNIGKFLQFLKDNHLYEDTAFVILGDHPPRGRSFKSSDKYHVPFVLIVPGVLEPKQVHTIAGQTDVLPTLVDLFHLSSPYSAMGKSLLEDSSKDWTFVTLWGEDFAFITPQSFIRSSQKESDFHQKMVGLNKAVYTALKNNHWAR